MFMHIRRVELLSRVLLRSKDQHAVWTLTIQPEIGQQFRFSKIAITVRMKLFMPSTSVTTARNSLKISTLIAPELVGTTSVSKI